MLYFHSTAPIPVVAAKTRRSESRTLSPKAAWGSASRHLDCCRLFIAQYCGWLRNPAPVNRWFIPLYLILFNYRVSSFNHPFGGAGFLPSTICMQHADINMLMSTAKIHSIYSLSLHEHISPATCQNSAGCWFQPLWKIWKSVGLISPNIWKVLKFMFQTTNQSVVHPWNTWVFPQLFRKAPVPGARQCARALHRSGPVAAPPRPTGHSSGAIPEQRPRHRVEMADLLNQ